MKLLTTLIEYLSLEESAEQLETMLSGQQALELYGNLPLDNVDARQYESLFLGGIYDFLNGVQLQDKLTEAVYIGRESSRGAGSTAAKSSTATIELRSPARILDLAHTFRLDPAQELLQPYQGQVRYLSLNELKGEIEHSAADPGEYLVLTLPGEHLSALLQDASFLAFLQQYHKQVNQRLQGKIKETAEKIGQLLRLERGDSLELDYLDVANLPRDFITTYEPQVLQEKGKVHHLYRKDGSIRQTLETNFNEEEGKVSLTRVGMNPEEKVELRCALDEGQLFYFRDVGIFLMRKYLETRAEPLIREPFVH